MNQHSPKPGPVLRPVNNQQGQPTLQGLRQRARRTQPATQIAIATVFHLPCTPPHHPGPFSFSGVEQRNIVLISILSLSLAVRKQWTARREQGTPLSPIRCNTCNITLGSIGSVAEEKQTPPVPLQLSCAHFVRRRTEFVLVS
ncbi:uncharacterized protein SPSK_00344 [Sporothrix schenckii 1099-18]|uniref:Uncharacterized protein n=1 Tax=Sporothrix schenckii 1099-18 TaxID=1397361 RepID=A0A0F2M2Q3_SPOSC|nr:uncharacterized protein SPSK_00344 [Sporothrix schenckii 1099-18]KJR83978.1 hypothetical protein SPSK_00344 [Sporothrix schenckii 1099-18]